MASSTRIASEIQTAGIPESFHRFQTIIAGIRLITSMCAPGLQPLMEQYISMTGGYVFARVLPGLSNRLNSEEIRLEEERIETKRHEVMVAIGGLPDGLRENFLQGLGELLSVFNEIRTQISTINSVPQTNQT